MKPASCKQLPGASCQALASLLPSPLHSFSLTQVQAPPAVPPLLAGTSYDQENWFLLFFIAISFIEHLLCARHWAGHLVLAPSKVGRPLRLPQVTAVPRPHWKADSGPPDPVSASILHSLVLKRAPPALLGAPSHGLTLPGHDGNVLVGGRWEQLGVQTWDLVGAASAPIPASPLLSSVTTFAKQMAVSTLQDGWRLGACCACTGLCTVLGVGACCAVRV